MRISDWSSDVCSSDLALARQAAVADEGAEQQPVERQQRTQPDERAGHVVDAVESARPDNQVKAGKGQVDPIGLADHRAAARGEPRARLDRKSTRLNSSH